MIFDGCIFDPTIFDAAPCVVATGKTRYGYGFGRPPARRPLEEPEDDEELLALALTL
jgi:hypothetical protein